MAEELCKHNKKPKECTDGCNPSHPAWLAKKLKNKTDNKMTRETEQRQENIRENERRRRLWKKK